MEAFTNRGGDLAGQGWKPEERSRGDRSRHEVVRIERNSCDIAGRESSCGVRIHGATRPDCKVAQQEEGGRGCQHSANHAKERRFAS